MAQTTTPKPVLDFSTLTDRRTARIDGVEYEIRTQGELSMLDLQLLRKMSAQLGEIESAASDDLMSDVQRAQYERLLDKSARLILIAPDEVHQRLTTGRREALLWAFLWLSSPRLRTATAMTHEATTKANATKARSRAGSRGSTAGRRRTG